MRDLLKPRVVLVEEAAESPLRDVVEQVVSFTQQVPQALALVKQGLDHHGKVKKAKRLKDVRWRREHSGQMTLLDATQKAGWDGEIEPEKLCLLQGRPRTPEVMVLIGMAVWGMLGGLKRRNTWMLLMESRTLHLVAARLGIEVPAPSTLWELIHALDEQTSSRLLDLQLAWLKGKDMVNPQQVYVDSTAVKANAAWPTDSGLIVALITRIHGVLSRYEQLWLHGGNAHRQSRTLKQQATGASLSHKHISLLPKGRKNTRRLLRESYPKLLGQARRFMKTSRSLCLRLEQQVAQLDELPSVYAKKVRAVAQCQQDIDRLGKVIEQAHRRVIVEQKVKASDKVLSVSDPSAAIIVKGQRQAILGYKPQLARDSRGFIVALLVTPGNSSDCAQMVPVFEQVRRRLGATPHVWSVDDGYASSDNRHALLQANVSVVSFSGSKGKRITPHEQWDQVEYVRARNERSLVESTMHALKSSVAFQRMSSRGIARVSAEMLQRVITHNFLLITQLRRKRPAVFAA